MTDTTENDLALAKRLVAEIEQHLKTIADMPERCGSRMAIAGYIAGACLAETAADVGPERRDFILVSAANPLLPQIVRVALAVSGLEPVEIESRMRTTESADTLQ